MGDRVVWKHIGLHGLSVGTFIADAKAITWKSAVLGNNDDVSISRKIPADALKGAQWSIFGRSGHIRIQTTGGAVGDGSANNNNNNMHHELRFDGFPPSDFEKAKTTLQDLFGVTLEKLSLSSSGTSYGKGAIKGRKLVFSHMLLEDANEEGEEFEIRTGNELMSLDLARVSQCVLPGNNRNEIELQFPESDTLEAGTDQLVSVRLYIPPPADFENNDKETPSNAELMQQKIVKTASIKKTSGNVICEFPEAKGTFLTPRGRYTIELYETFLRMRGNKYDYKIRYDDISRLFLLPKPDEVHMAFVIALDKPIRQGQQRYQYLVLQTNKEQAEVTINLSEEALEKDYKGDLQPVMTGQFSNLVAKTFKIIAKKKVFIPGKFANANQQACVKCALRANEGLLYPLEKQFLFIHKPPVLIRFDEVESVEFQRYAGGQGSTRNFDLCVTLQASAAAAGTKEYTFSGIDRTDYTGLYNFLSGKKIVIKNLEGVGLEEARPTAPVYDENIIYGVGGEEDEEESEDEDFDANENNEGGEDSESEDIDDDDLGSEIDDDLDSDIEEARKKSGKPAKSKKIAKKRKAEESHDDEDEEEKPKKKKKKAAVSSPTKAMPKKKKKKDAKAPKKPSSAYNFFTSVNRAKLKEENPDATFGDLSKMVAVDYKKMSESEKKKYEDMASEDKERYTTEMKDYVPPSDDDDDDDGGSDKKKVVKKKAKKDPNAPKKPMTGFMLYSVSVRSTVKGENPEMAFGDIARAIAAKYKALSADEMAKLNERADADKQRYKQEMAAYKKKQVAEAAQILDDEESDDDDDDE